MAFGNFSRRSRKPPSRNHLLETEGLARFLATVSIEPIGSFSFQVLYGWRRQSRCAFKWRAICDNVGENGARQFCSIETA